ncbi:MAG: monovalent cation/H(+) antiporter subunit G [Paracoccaceae bacterium]
MSQLDTLLEVLSWFFILSGAFFVVIGAVGTLRFPDFWSRLHAASVTESAGVLLVFAGLCIQAGFTLITVKIIIIGIFLFITGPTSTHAIANAALVTGLRPKEVKGFAGVEPEPLTKNPADPAEPE